MRGVSRRPHLSEGELLAWRGMLELEARVLAVLDAELREKRDLSVSEFDALYQLWIQPGGRCRMKDLANRLLVSRGGATKLIIRLEQRGLVRRVSQSGLQAVTAELTRRRRVGAGRCHGYTLRRGAPAGDLEARAGRAGRC